MIGWTAMKVSILATVLAALAMGLVTPSLPAGADDENNNLRAGDNIVTLADQPADDAELASQNGTPPQTASGRVDMPPAQGSDSLGTTAGAGSGGFSTYSGDTTGIAVSTVTATVTNNDFHN